MIEFLAFIIMLLMFAAVISSFVGLIVPSAFTRLFKKNLGRGKTWLIFSGIAFLLFILLGVTASNIPDQPTQQKDTETKISPTKSQEKNTTQGTKKPIPEPTENCAESVNPELCIRMELLKRPELNATTQLTNAGLVIRNNDDVDWRLCTLSIGSENLSTMYEVSGWDIAFPAHQTTTIPWGNFVQQNGGRFNYYTTEPRDIELDCSVNHEQQHLRIN